MPKGRRYKRRNYRPKKNNRMHRRKNKYSARAATMTVRGPTGIPDKMRVRLRYVENVTIAPAVAFQDYIFRGNSAFDPNFTGGGHQPYYYDQYAALYTKYRVRGSSIRVDVVNQSAVMAVSTIIVPHSDSAAFASISAAAEMQRSRYPKIIPIAQRVSVVLKEYASSRAVLGYTKGEMNDDTTASTVTTNPATSWWWHILMESTDSTTTLTVQLQVRIEYYMEFFDPVIVAQS